MKIPHGRKAQVELDPFCRGRDGANPANKEKCQGLVSDFSKIHLDERGGIYLTMGFLCKICSD